MLVRYWKNFKWFLFIPLIVFVFAFKISNVNALVYKDSVHLGLSTYNYSGNISSSNGEKSFTWTLDTPIQKNNYDILQVRFNYMLFMEQNIVDLTDNYYICTEWTYNGTLDGYQCTDFDLTNYNTTSTFKEGSYYIRAISVNSNGTGTPCFISSELEGSLLCPINNNITNIQFSIYTFGYKNFNYKYSISGVSAYWNYDNTDITLQQTQTNTNLQYIYQYQQNDSVSGSTTQVQGDFSDLATSFNSELQGVNDLSQLVLMPISLFMDLSTDNCQPLHLQIPYVNMSVDLPCMKAIFNQYFNGLYSIFTTIMSAVICYWVAIKTGALVKEIVDCDNDRIEVVDL